eukprot:g9732.t2
MQRVSEKTPLVAGHPRPRGSPTSSGPQPNDATGARGRSSPPPTPAKTRLRKLHSAPIKDFLSTGTDMDSLRLSYAAKLVLAAVEGRHVESAVDLLVLKGGIVNPLAYPLYSPILMCIILGHLALALWEGGMSPFPLHPAVAASEACVALFYAAHILLNLWTFGVKQYRDKKWHFIFTVLAVAHLLLMVSAALAANSATASGRRAAAAAAAAASTAAEATRAGGVGIVEGGWWNGPRLALLGAQALRPMMLISNLKTIRRVFTNVLRTAKQTGSILTLGAVVLASYSVLGINLFNSEQVSGYDFDRDNFDDFGRSLLSLFVLVTEENFPEVADPSFTQRPLVAFPFFISFLLLFLVVILPLLLGIVLDAYAQQHARQHERYRRKARNALLAAYFILDDDGVRGLSRDQLVGVLTTEAGVGIDTEQAEQLWHVIVPEDAHGWLRSKYARSYSVPVATNDASPSSSPPWQGPASVSTAAPVVSGSSSSDTATTIINGSSDHSVSNATGGAFEFARSRARSLPHGPVGNANGGGGGHSGSGSSARRGGRWHRNGGAGKDSGGGRMDVRGFLRLADLLHQRVVDDGEGDGGGGGEGRGRRGARPFLAGFDDEGVGPGPVVTARSSLAGPGGSNPVSEGRTSGGVGGGFQEDEDEDEFEVKGETSGEEEDEEQPCCFSGEDGHGHGHSAPPPMAPRGGTTSIGGGGGGGDVAASSSGDGGGGGAIPLSRRKRLERCARRALGQATAIARVAVGRRWFAMLSRGIAVSFTMLTLVWTPLSQQRYDGCPGQEDCVAEKDMDEDEVDYWREDLMRRLEGLVLLAFAGEMAAKVLAVGCRRLWRLHWAHRFDLVVLGTCLASYLSVGMPGNTLALYVDRHPDLSDVMELPRALAVLRLVTVFPQLRRLVETMLTVAAMLVKIMVLYSCVSYSFATVGMAIFADATSDLLEPRYSFSTLPEACMALFFMTVSNNWNDLLYPLVNSVRAGRWSSIYFVAYMLFCSTMMLDVLVGVVIEGFRVSTKGPDQASPEALVAPRSPEGGGVGNSSRNGSSGAESDSGGDLDVDVDGSMSSGNSVRGDKEGGAGGSTQHQQDNLPSQRRRRAMLTRKASQRKYTQVKAEDMFRPEAKVWRAQGVWDEGDVRELDEAVQAVEGRLHQAWVTHVRKSGSVGERDSV